MSSVKRHLVLTTFLALGIWACPKHAYAYLDPGSGSYIFQLLIASLLGAVFAMKMFWRNIRSFLARLFSRPQEWKRKH